MAREVHHTGSTLSTDSPASRAATQSATVRTNWFWPGFVITLLGTQVVLILVMAYVASYDRSFAVEPDYYQQALHWNAHQAQTRANQALGWRVEMGVSDESDVYRNRGIRCTISDRTGNPIDGAHVEIVAFSHVRGADRQHATLVPRETGRYDGQLRVTHGGLWEFRISIQRGTERYTTIERTDISLPGVSPP